MCWFLFVVSSTYSEVIAIWEDDFSPPNPDLSFQVNHTLQQRLLNYFFQSSVILFLTISRATSSALSFSRS